MANTPEKPQMTDDERAELRAMIAAGRDLSPDMDESLVDSYAERRAAENRRRRRCRATRSSHSSSLAAHCRGASCGGYRRHHREVAAIFIAIMLFIAWLRLVADLPAGRHLRRLVGK